MESRTINSYQEFILMLENNSPYLRWIKASYSVWIDILTKYSEYKNEVSLNKNLPDQILKLLAEDDDWQIRSTIAMKRKLPYEVFFKLAFDKNESVRMSIALNRKTPFEVLNQMKNDSWKDIVSIIEKRTNT